MSGIDRRSFFRIVAASGAAAAAGGCGPAAEHLLPHVTEPDNVVPGVPAWFATVCRECPAGCGVLAKNREGRVIKLEGNPDHPVNGGALCIRGQAALQAVYHPDRFRGALLRGAPVPLAQAVEQVAALLGALAKGGQGRKIALVSRLETGALARLMDEWVKALGARPRLAWEPLGYEALRAANRAVFGRDTVGDYAIGEAAALVSFGADFLETWLSPVGYAQDFARMHALGEGRAGSFVHVEPRLSLTAASADRWLRNAPGTEGLLALAMLRVILDEGLVAPGVDPRPLAAAVQGVDVGRAAASSGVPAQAIAEVARGLAGSRAGLAVGGGAAVTGPNATATLAAINLLNVALGAVGPRLRLGAASAWSQAGGYADMLALVQAMGRGEIEVLILAGVNPVYALPPKAGFAEALGKVPLVVSLAERPDETTARAHVVLPALHWLEAWGDYAPDETTRGLIQPAMGPVQVGDTPAEARSTGDLLLALGRAALGTEAGQGPLPWASVQEMVKTEWQGIAKARGEAFLGFWEDALRRGGLWRDVSAPAPTVRGDAAAAAAEPARLEGQGSHALLLYPSLRLYDGRGADLPWLQEAPDPVTQVSWDAWVELPEETARSLGVARGDLVRLSSPHGSVELPAYPRAALHPGVVAVPLGQGHAYPGAYARSRGVNAGANPLALLGATPEAGSGALPYLSVRVTLAAAGGRRPLAVPQAQFDQDDREIAQFVELGAAKELELRGKAPAHASHPSMYPERAYPEHRWGMTVDLDRCTGCSACVVACQAENNVPVVGKEQVAYGRLQLWLRIERWEEGPAAAPVNLFLPMFCQHCAVAPCEPVCPVYAAYHTEEGLNAQVYNRCVGTRYCGNNCPYHVRRFNWFSYTWPAPLDQQLNPEVTVRQLGVMEKCTMCVQRIVAGKAAARDEGRRLRDGEIQTACQQTCPTAAITFGDLKDGGARVAQLSASPRGYHVLEELGTRPAVTYLRKVVHGPAPAAPAKGH
jgi:molybdopterin-containing oxidoreductase family iron-sulfur binding subunit